MATLCVKNVPDDLYEALREAARANGRSIAAEFRALLEEMYPTKRDLGARLVFLNTLQRLRARKPQRTKRVKRSH
jgi:plasmid stability protein